MSRSVFRLQFLRYRLRMKCHGEIPGYRSRDTHSFFCDWMGEFQLKRMERLSFYDPIVWVIEKITEKGMPNVFHMYPDLVGTAGFQVKLDEGVGMTDC